MSKATMSELTVAIDLYDRHLPLFMDQVAPPEGVAIRFLEVGMAPPRRHGIDRHRRMLVEREFDAAEVSLASFIVALSQDVDDLVGIPVFPRRLFSHNHIFVSERSGIRQPVDLVGRKVAIWAFQVTMSVLAKGDLQRDHGVSWRDIRWRAQHPEEIPADYGSDVDVAPLGGDGDVVEALLSGAVDAYINPHPPEAVMTPGNGICRLTPEPEAAGRSYAERHGYLPIMHLIAVKRAVMDKVPALGRALIGMFDRAREISRDYYVDPGFSQIAHARNALERQIEAIGADPWTSGLAANRRNLADFIGFCHDQRLIGQPMEPEALFHETTFDT